MALLEAPLASMLQATNFASGGLTSLALEGAARATPEAASRETLKRGDRASQKGGPKQRDNRVMMGGDIPPIGV